MVRFAARVRVRGCECGGVVVLGRSVGVKGVGSSHLRGERFAWAPPRSRIGSKLSKGQMHTYKLKLKIFNSYDQSEKTPRCIYQVENEGIRFEVGFDVMLFREGLDLLAGQL